MQVKELEKLEEAKRLKNIKKDIKKQDADVARRQEEQRQRGRIDGLLRLYQDARAIEKTETFNVNIKDYVVTCLATMINIVEKDDWYSIHLHEAFPKIDIRMLIGGCPVSNECPFLLAILRKIGMSKADYVNYRKRAGMMIAIEHKRKMGKKR